MFYCKRFIFNFRSLLPLFRGANARLFFFSNIDFWCYGCYRCYGCIFKYPPDLLDIIVVRPEHDLKDVFYKSNSFTKTYFKEKTAYLEQSKRREHFSKIFRKCSLYNEKRFQTRGRTSYAKIIKKKYFF